MNKPPVELPFGLVDALYGYLANRPYKEVQHYLKAIEECYKQHTVKHPLPEEEVLQPDEIEAVISKEAEEALLKAHGVVSE